MLGGTINTQQIHTQPRALLVSVHCHPGAGLIEVGTWRSAAIGLQFGAVQKS